MREIILIQHCQSEHHINNMSGGWTDTPLTNLGKKQANLIGTRLKAEIKPENFAIYSSDLLRAWQTAEIVGEHLQLPIVVNEGLREINTGIAAGKTKDCANANRKPRRSQQFDLDYQQFEDGETWGQFYYRVCSCMNHILVSTKKNLVIVTHGGTLAFIIAWWLNFDKNMLITSHFSASPGSISILGENDYQQHVLKRLNDTVHLAELP